MATGAELAANYTKAKCMDKMPSWMHLIVWREWWWGRENAHGCAIVTMDHKINTNEEQCRNTADNLVKTVLALLLLT